MKNYLVYVSNNFGIEDVFKTNNWITASEMVRQYEAMGFTTVLVEK